MLTLQQIFDKAARHLLKQMEQSWRGGACAYRGDAGLKCAVGALINDEDYHQGVERHYSTQAVVETALKSSKVDVSVPEIRCLVSHLQSLHDNNNPKTWVENLTALANEHKLSTRVL